MGLVTSLLVGILGLNRKYPLDGGEGDFWASVKKSNSIRTEKVSFQKEVEWASFMLN